LNPHAEGH
jgi:hypothetical protein